jgi:hypothetical protein
MDPNRDRRGDRPAGLPQLQLSADTTVLREPRCVDPATRPGCSFHVQSSGRAPHALTRSLPRERTREGTSTGRRLL